MKQRIGEQFSDDNADSRVAAALLLTIATVGISVMAGFLHSQWQIGAFAVFVIVGIVGLVLTWRSRPQRRPGGAAHSDDGATPTERCWWRG